MLKFSPSIARYSSIIVTKLSFALGLSLLLSTGPQIQTYLTALISSNQGSIYATAYSDNLVKFPVIGDWFSEGIQWQFLLMACAITWFVLRHRQPRAVLTTAVLSSFFVLMAGDIGFGIASQDGLSAPEVIENAIFNLIGSLVVAWLIFVCLCTIEMVLKYANGTPATRRILAVLAGFAFFCGCTGFVYFAVSFLYKPLPVKVDVHFDRPSHVTLSALPPKAKGELSDSDKAEQAFEFFPKNRQGGLVRWTSPESALVASWSRPHGFGIFDITMTFYAGCMEGSDTEKLARTTKSFRYLDIKDFKMNFDKGPTGLSTFGRALHEGSYELVNSEPGMYSLDAGTLPESIKLTEFVGADATLRYRTSSDALEIYMSAPLLGMQAGRNTVAPRTLHTTINGTDHVMDFNPPASVDWSGSVNCKQLDVDQSAEAQAVIVDTGSIQAGVAVKISPRRIANEIYHNESNILTVVNGNGWFSVDDIPPRSFASVGQGGWAKFMMFGGNILSMSVDDIPNSTNASQSFSIMKGRMYGAFDSSGKLRFFGDAEFMYRDQVRVNTTRWERADWALKAPISGLLLSIFVFFGGLVVRRVKLNVVMEF